MAACIDCKNADEYGRCKVFLCLLVLVLGIMSYTCRFQCDQVPVPVVMLHVWIYSALVCYHLCLELLLNPEKKVVGLGCRECQCSTALLQALLAVISGDFTAIRWAC
jgi:hypothetical protein